MLNVTDSLLSVGMVLVVTTSAMYITEVETRSSGTASEKICLKTWPHSFWMKGFGPILAFWCWLAWLKVLNRCTNEDDVMYEFASIVSTTMLGAIGFAVFIMCLMTVSALIWRGSLGGRKDDKGQGNKELVIICHNPNSHFFFRFTAGLQLPVRGLQSRT